MTDAAAVISNIGTTSAIARCAPWQGEVLWPVPPLSVPSLATDVSVADVLGSEAGQLFAQRAAAVRPGYTVTPLTAPAVARICHRPDGMPLPIELAAAWVRVLGPEQIAARVAARLDLLATASRSSPRRHLTLRATLDWIHALLGEQEQVLLRRLGVFAGGWTLEAAEAVCAGDGLAEGDVLRLLASLVDRSLVGAVGERGAVR
jgi:predicted ATPase